ncbi:MAG: 4Fe-4S binding protein [Arenicellales bacterium]|nr:4Fe-4S binding protein [Arenicellales bacterium]
MNISEFLRSSLFCSTEGGLSMMHPGLPPGWAGVVGVVVALLSIRLLATPKAPAEKFRFRWMPSDRRDGALRAVGALGPMVRQILKLALVALFGLTVIAGLFGTPIPERNLATVLTWNVWWAALILSIFFAGSFWCGVCPWNTIAGWLVRRGQTGNAVPNNSLNLRVPKILRNVWPALALLTGLTWLELGAGLPSSPRATAILALLMVVLATVSLAIYERRAFCRYFCPVGRTVGFYSQLAPIELRPVDLEVCERCDTLACYHGTDQIEPCPTHLVMGRLTENTYCTSCGNCVGSCPSKNVNWRLRPHSIEVIKKARPHWDEAWFMLCLLALTGFHGLTMTPLWEKGISSFARIVGDSGKLLPTFTFFLLLSLAVPAIVYFGAVRITYLLTGKTVAFKKLFSSLALMTLPLAFAYHLAHNLSHLVRESDGVLGLLLNPLGTGTFPLTLAEKQDRHLDMLISPELVFALQASLIVFGFWIALKVLHHRYRALFAIKNSAGLTPMVLLAMGFTGFHLWLLMQPMIMRL